MKHAAIAVLALAGVAASANAQNLPVLIEVDISDLSAVTFTATGAAPVATTSISNFQGFTMVEIATDNSATGGGAPGGTLAGPLPPTRTRLRPPDPPPPPASDRRRIRGRPPPRNRPGTEHRRVPPRAPPSGSSGRRPPGGLAAPWLRSGPTATCSGVSRARRKPTSPG